MRFNGKELAALALQPSHKFDKEGILLVRERQEGLFRRGEISAERWCRLRGNMLFYFKNRDQYSEAAGVIILEQCSVHLDTTCDDGPHSFTIAFDIDGGNVQFSASSEHERDAWIQSLHMASYEYMRTQLNTLNAKLDEKMDKLKINMENSKNIWATKNFTDLSEEPYLEMSISCDNLMCDGDGQPPNPVVFVSLIVENKPQWSNYAQTEVIERSSNPCFLTTVNLRLSDVNVSNTKVKLAVYDVRERLTSTMTLLGSAVFAFESLSTEEKNNARHALISGDDAAVGFISITCWKVNTDKCNETSENGSGRAAITVQPTDTYQLPSLPVGLMPKSRLPHCGNLNLLFDSIISRSYRFHTGLGADLSVHEIMGESKFCFILPQKILQLFIKEEKDLLHALTTMGNLRDEWNKRQTDLLERHLHLVNLYTLALHNMDSHAAGVNFKPSSSKNCQNLEFVPVNLHLQRIWVHNDSVKKSSTFDVFTVGAFAAHSRRYRHGGLSRLLSQLRQQHETKNEKGDKLGNITEVVAHIKHLKACIEDLIQQLITRAFEKNASEMCSIMTTIATKSHQFIGICDSALIDDACSLLEEMRSSQIEGQEISEVTPTNLNSPLHDIKVTKERSRSIDGPYLNQTKPTDTDNCDSALNLDKVTIEPRTIIEANVKIPMINSKKMDNKKDSISPRSLRRRGIRMTRHGSLKDDKLKNSSNPLRSAIICEKKLDLTTNVETEKPSIKSEMKTITHPVVSAAKSDLVISNNLKNEENSSPSSNCNNRCKTTEKISSRSKSPDEPEPWDLTQLNIEASIMCMSSKVKSLCRCTSADDKTRNTTSSVNVDRLNWADKLAPSVRKLTQALNCLLRTANLAHVVYLLMEPLQLAAQQRSVQHRRDIVFIHALTSVIVGIMTKLWDHRLDATYMLRMSKVGILAQFEGLLSCHGDEMGMLEDMVVAIEDVSKVTFKIVQAADSSTPILPKIEGGRMFMTVTFLVPDTIMSLLPTECSKGFIFHVTPVFFNVGINEQASIAERESCSPSCMHSVPLSARKSIACMYSAAPNPNRFGDMSLQDKINTDGLEKLNEFYNKYRQVPITAERGTRPSPSKSLVVIIPEILDHLKLQVHAKRGKNVEILHSASKICRLLGGLRFTSCKSAKDRTSMSVTLEQCTILREQFDLAEPEFFRALECMRCEGTRRENALKNAGVKKYAFNSLQLMALPKLYRPPAGTYGNVQT